MGSSGDGLPGPSAGPDAAEASAAAAFDASVSDAATGTSVDDAASGPADTGGEASVATSSASCDYVVDTAPVVTETYGAGSFPAYTKGGTIADGIYWLTSLVSYSSVGTADAASPTYQETVEVFGTSWNNVDVYAGGTRRATETLTVHGASGTLMYTCDSLNDPNLLQETVSFTFEVDGNTLLLADVTDGYALTYVRQSP